MAEKPNPTHSIDDFNIGKERSRPRVPGSMAEWVMNMSSRVHQPGDRRRDKAIVLWITAQTVTTTIQSARLAHIFGRWFNC